MKVILISIDNGYIRRNQTQPVVVCANQESADKYMKENLMSERVYEKAFHTKRNWQKGEYFTQEVDVYL